MQEIGKTIAKAQQYYKENFDKKVRRPKKTIDPGSFVFVLKKFYGPYVQKHKLALVFESSFQVVWKMSTKVLATVGKEQKKSVTGQSSRGTIGRGDDKKGGAPG